MSYLDVDGFKDLTTMPSAAVDELELVAPGFLTAQLAAWSAWLNSRLAKRYAVPFVTPYPIAVQFWLARIVTPRAFQRRGVDANDEQYIDIRDDAKAAEAEVLEAANSDTGLFDLPLRADTDATGVARGGTRVYSEQSPYVAFDDQRSVGRSEDRNRGGTTL